MRVNIRMEVRMNGEEGGRKEKKDGQFKPLTLHPSTVIAPLLRTHAALSYTTTLGIV